MRGGEVAVGGGAAITGGGASTVGQDYPVEADGSLPEIGDEATGWEALGYTIEEDPQTLRVVALCAPAAG